MDNLCLKLHLWHNTCIIKETRMKHLIHDLETLLNIKSPTGNTEEAVLFCEERFKALGLKTRRTVKGALIASLEGECTEKEVTLSAHVDTLGCLVKEITSDGKLRLTQLGGYAWSTIEGEHVAIETLSGSFYSGTILTNVASSHVHGALTSTTERTQKNLEVRIDEKVKTHDDVVALGINVGDYVHLDPRCKTTDSGFIKSRHLDDKACVIALFGIAEHFVSTKTKPSYTTNFFISTFEEVGHGSSAAIPEKTFEFIAVDMAAPGQGQTSDEFSVTICAKDSSGPYDYDLRKRLVALASQNNIPHKIDIYPYYGSDASAALRAGYDFKAGLIGPGVDASHSFERTHEEAIKATIDLGIAYLSSKF
ncbi:M42 family metallopeptidase [Erysipelothrix rhusiopathiae]|nr:M42 family metallopeptidase [Erysipelothrix rhusiopathiae]MDV7682021.1 M42 family metallopeptidase [Erysipelothrix rhusiopathiae]MDV7683822.1 M42 family metallopeptidase [Erysipelothrix rhusiopathiae]MDV7685508.1 M42 family metallopeptidase [Erysipelothrix rhusiopathiae]WMT70833.1 M42 family metallopeptidase [Erysipelothrix rhusiopathiae]